MNSRERFRETMGYGKPDRVPYFEEGIRDDVLSLWRRQGLAPDADLSEMFPSDEREELIVDLEPLPWPRKWPTSSSELEALRRRLHPDDPRRLPKNWAGCVRAWQARDHVLMLRVHRGFFLSLGVRDWSRFTEVIRLLIEDPRFVRNAMAIQADFAARLVEKVLREVEIDAAVFTEPIGGNDRPLISPGMYEEFVLASYEPVLEALRRHRVETIVLRTFANSRLLIPSVLKWGFNCLWACEVNVDAMDYRDIRLDALRHDKEAIRREIEEKVPPLLDEGGYVPLADGRVREDVPFENYVYYRELLERVTRG
jgi:hypothetical protein